ncbi:MCP four helix bundle domain-containing protein [Paenibacillus agricola]|uniref:Chemotaxis methyl-accepting receptor HlyB-like 4HB MCP domain-containing protein n=1 Tax=Paenibacillus agricola TaxID=2716264 RepID=A0ABX0JFL0_9BACL|nr:MCP four helix bundle domain-containing protein [Paenibacillus agricola]NHN34054.1 hypothetical protein [Paenibacillus agricola]
MNIKRLQIHPEWLGRARMVIPPPHFAVAVRKKLIGSFVIVILLGFFGWTSLSRIASIQQDNENITNFWQFNIETMNKINGLAEQMPALQGNRSLEPNEDIKKQLMPEALMLFTAVELNLQHYETKIRTEEEQVYWDMLSNAWKNYKDFHSNASILSTQVIVVDDPGTNTDPSTKMLTSTQDAYDRMQKQLDLLIKLNREGNLASTAENERLYNQALAETVMTFLFAAAIAAGLSRVISKL